MAEIIRQAVEIQSGSASAQEGISEDELRQAAAELGIESGALSAALNSADVSEASAKSNIWGGPTRSEAERVLDGTITEDQWEEIVSELRSAFEEPGTVERRGETYEWSGTGGGLEYNTITVRQSGKTVRLKAVSSGAGLGTIGYLLGFLPIFMTVGLLTKVGLSAPMMALAISSTVALMFFAARQATISAIRRRRRIISNLFDRIQSRLESSNPDLRANLSRPQTTIIDEAEAIEQSVGPGEPGTGVP